MKIPKTYITYFVIFNILFAIFIYRQNVQYYKKYSTHLRCEENASNKTIGGKYIVDCESDDRVRIVGRLEEQPYQSGSVIVMRLDGIRVETRENIGLSIGDRVEVVGNLERRVTDNQYIQIWLVGSAKRVISKSENESIFSMYKWQHAAYGLSEKIADRLASLYKPPFDGLIAGILIGKQSTLPRDFYDALITTGTIHIVAASGYNVSLVVALMMRVFTRLFSRKKATIFAFIGVVFFVLMAGSGPAVVRAGIMGSLILLGSLSGRVNISLYALYITSIIMLLLNPLLINSVSFLLSASSTFGILLLSPMFESFLKQNNRKGESLTILQKILSSGVMDVSTTLSATIATLPIVLIYFDRVSLLSLPVNMLVLWTIPPMMMFGFLAWITSFFSQVASGLFALLSLPYLIYFQRMIEWFGRLSFASITLDWFNEYMMFGYFLTMILISMLYYRKRPMHA